jgi:hypothetical protein
VLRAFVLFELGATIVGEETASKQAKKKNNWDGETICDSFPMVG